MRVLTVCGDHWHPVETVRGGLAPLEGGEWSFDWLEDGSRWAEVHLADYAVVLLSKSDNVTAKDETPWVTAAVQQALSDYVRGGGGLLAVHSGTVYKEVPPLRELLGGAFDHHPPQCAVTIAPTAAEHPLTAGVTPFTVKDEHYFMLFDANGADVFLQSSSEHGSQPAGWTRREGKGRLCVLTPGHNLEVWLQPSYQALLRNALRWCGRIPA